MREGDETHRPWFVGPDAAPDDLEVDLDLQLDLPVDDPEAPLPVPIHRFAPRRGRSDKPGKEVARASPADPAAARNADARNADARNADARGADARDADARGADVRNGVAQNAVAQDGDPRKADILRSTDGRNADGRIADGRDADGRDADGRDADARDLLPAESPSELPASERVRNAEAEAMSPSNEAPSRERASGEPGPASSPDRLPTGLEAPKADVPPPATAPAGAPPLRDGEPRSPVAAGEERPVAAVPPPLPSRTGPEEPPGGDGDVLLALPGQAPDFDLYAPAPLDEPEDGEFVGAGSAWSAAVATGRQERPSEPAAPPPPPPSLADLHREGPQEIAPPRPPSAAVLGEASGEGPLEMVAPPPPPSLAGLHREGPQEIAPPRPPSAAVPGEAGSEGPPEAAAAPVQASGPSDRQQELPPERMAPPRPPPPVLEQVTLPPGVPPPLAPSGGAAPVPAEPATPEPPAVVGEPPRVPRESPADIPPAAHSPGAEPAGRIPAASEAPAAAAPLPTFVAGERSVVVHTRDGRALRGSLRDVDLAAPTLPLETRGGTVRLPIDRVRAVFFVVPVGMPLSRPEGRRARVVLEDGRPVVGLASGFHPDAPGFFITPDEPRGRTERIYLYRDAIRSITFPRR